jgi:hypothetical protein
MLPSEYVSEVVLPTVDEFLAATGELRRAILACVVSYHVRDYLAKASGCSMGEVDRRIRAMSAFSFDVVEGVCNGSLHVRNTKHGKFKFTPGDEKPILYSLLMRRGRGWMRPASTFPVWRSSIRAGAHLSTCAFAPCSAQSAWSFPRSSRAWTLKATENGCPVGLLI